MIRISMIVFALLALTSTAHSAADSSFSSYSELRSHIELGNIASATITDDGRLVVSELKNGDTIVTHVSQNTPIADRMVDAGIPTSFTYDQDPKTPLWLSIFFNILPFLIFLAFFFFVMRSVRKSTGGQEGYISRAEKLQNEFLTRLEKLLLESRPNG